MSNEKPEEFIAEAVSRVAKQVGLTPAALEQLHHRRDEFEKLLSEALSRFTENGVGYRMARALLGEDFIPPESIMGLRKGFYPDNQLAWYRSTLPSREQLEQARQEGYILIAGPAEQMSFLAVQSLWEEYFSRLKCAWCSQHPFAAKSIIRPGWLMLRKAAVPDSSFRKWDEQWLMLAPSDEVPNIAEVAWGASVYRAVCHKQLFSDGNVRTSSQTSAGQIVNFYGAKGAGPAVVHYCHGGRRVRGLGIAAKRR